ncbi:MAG TPA: LamG domain-containing protein [Solirubrobacteraceae bacterium]|nr:LamG domain-containing protein [Solirubrobacteraceae bacterium]
MRSPAPELAGQIRRIAVAGLLGAAVALTATAAPAAAAPALAGHWSFDEGAGQTAHDAGPLRLHGVLGASPVADAEDPAWIAGASGGALRFGAGASVRVSDGRRLDLQTLTVEVVARADSSPGVYRYLVAHGSVGCFAGAYGLYTGRDGGVAFYVFDGERYFVSAAAPASAVWNGAWHRVSGTFDGSRLRLFVDGHEVGGPFATPAGTAIEYDSMPEGTYFGSYMGACRLPFTGDVDSVTIWSGGASAGIAAQSVTTAAGTPLAPAAAGTAIRTPLPKSSCRVRTSRKLIRTKRRRIALTAHAAGPRGPLRRVRLAVRRANGRKVVAVARTNAKGRARVVLKVARSKGRLRIGVVGRANCTPAFVKVLVQRDAARRR